MPTVPTVNVQSGVITPANAVIDVGDHFTWVSTAAPPGANVTVSPLAQAWFVPVVPPPQGQQFQFSAPGPSPEVVAELASPGPGWKWSSNMYVDQNAHVNVGAHIPAQKKAS